MIIFGVDPGTATTGYGVIEVVNNQLNNVAYGCIRTSSELSHHLRLFKIYQKLLALIDLYSPGDIAVEKVFFNLNTKTAMLVGEARGVVMLAAATRGLRVFEYTPLQIKMSLVGFGRAEKGQVQAMVKEVLGLDCLPTPDDAADALAAAVCHAHSLKYFRKIGEADDFLSRG